jgi:Flp pilus assembly protein TadG
MNTQRRRGQSLVELALALPVVLLLGLAIADVGRAFYYHEAVSNAARQALRIAVLDVQQATGNTACAGGGSSASLTSAIPPVSGNTLSTIGNEVALESTYTGMPAASAIAGATLTVTWHCAANVAVTNASATATDPASTGADAIEVQITYPMPLITPFLGNFVASPIQVKADVQGRSQY